MAAHPVMLPNSRSPNSRAVGGRASRARQTAIWPLGLVLAERTAATGVRGRPASASCQRDQSGQGLACHRIGEGRIAAIATATQGEGGVKVEKLSAAVDIGRIVNLDIARQQIEGGLIFGIGLALGCSTDYERGLPTEGRLAGFNLPQLRDCPEIEVDFIASQAEPADPGELGVAVAAPAIANALFSATGLRLRRLPLLSGGL